MKLTVLGSGTAVIRKERKGASYMLETGGKYLLFDCGWGCPDGLLAAGFDILNIDHILLSHPHADHMSSLMNILQSMVVSGLSVSGEGYEKRRRDKPLVLHGYSGFNDNYETLRGMMVPERTEPYEITVIEYTDNESVYGDLTIRGRSVPHTEYFNSLAFSAECEGKKFVYSGDCAMNSSLLEFSQGADLAVYEASIPQKSYNEDGPSPNHMSALECGMIAGRAGVKKLVLSHLYDNETEAEMTEDVKKNFNGELAMAKDLLTLEF